MTIENTTYVQKEIDEARELANEMGQSFLGKTESCVTLAMAMLTEHILRHMDVEADGYFDLVKSISATQDKNEDKGVTSTSTTRGQA